MRTKPAVIGACASLLLAGACVTGGFATSAQAAPPPTLVLYPRIPDNPDDVRALVDLRKKLRADGQFDVLTYDPASATIVRAVGDAHHPELLTGPMTADGDRLALARVLGAAFFVVVSRGDGHGKSDLHLVETAPSARNWNIQDRKTDDAARAVEEQATDAIQHPVFIAARSILTKPPTAPGPARPAVTPPFVIVGRPAVSVPTPSDVLPAKPSRVAAAAPVPVTAPLRAPTPDVALPPAPAAVPTIVAPSSTPIPAPATVPVIPPAVPATLPPPTTTKTLPLQTEIAPSSSPIPAPARVEVVPPPSPNLLTMAPSVDDLSGINNQLRQGDDQLAQGDFVAAISAYRDAVNGAPLSAVPRLKLARAYLEAGMRDKALDEAQRALQIAPASESVQQFLTQIDAQTGTADGAVARFSARVAADPQDADAHLELGDAFWNNSTLDQAEAEYKTAQRLAGPGTTSGEAAASHLARLYAAQKRYGESLAALKQAGPGGYALALGIVQSRVDTLSSTIDSAQDQFTAGRTTHADFYKTMGDVSAQAQRLADFVIQVTPPAAFKLSHLYRVQATHLLAQQAAVLVTYIETSDPSQADRAAQLGKSAQTEMLMAHAAEQKLGLWGGKQTEAKN